MKVFAVFGHRVRGFRVIDLGAIAVLTVLVLVVYLAKAGAGGTRADIDAVRQQIVEEQSQIRLLRAEVASEEQPERLASLSAQYLNLQPIPATHDIPAEALADIVRAPPPKTPPETQPAQPVASSAPAAAVVMGGR
jgi:cell division protein FtsL